MRSLPLFACQQSLEAILSSVERAAEQPALP